MGWEKRVAVEDDQWNDNDDQSPSFNGVLGEDHTVQRRKWIMQESNICPLIRRRPSCQRRSDKELENNRSAVLFAEA